LIGKKKIGLKMFVISIQYNKTTTIVAREGLLTDAWWWCWWRMNEDWVWETNTGFVVCKLRLSEDSESSLVYLPLSLTTWHY
jgi:hypothetical protein